MKKKHYIKNSNIVSRIIADECILVPIKHTVEDLGSIYALNEVGTFIWNSIDGNKTVEEIKEMVIEQFEASPEQIEIDLIEFIEQLESLRMVIVNDSTSK